MRSTIPKLIMIAAPLLALAGCAGVPPIPDTTYYRLPQGAPVERFAEPLIQRPLMVPGFYADGVHSDQAMLYAMDPDALRLRAYHYQLWVDPPTRMLQRRLIGTLRRSGISPLVADSLPSQSEPVEISGRVVALERVPVEGGWRVHVALGLRYDPTPGNGDRPPLVRLYREDLAVEDATVAASARKMGEAVDRIYASFLDDLKAHLQAGETP